MHLGDAVGSHGLPFILILPCQPPHKPTEPLAARLHRYIVIPRARSLPPVVKLK